jgi:hypothetical protein
MNIKGPTKLAERNIKWLLRVIGGICLLALIALWMPSNWIALAHEKLGLGSFPEAPIALYLARSVSSLSAFYGGLLLILSTDVQRYRLVIRFQAIAILFLSASGVIVGTWAGLPLWFVGGDAIACWAYCVPMLTLAKRISQYKGAD